MRNLNDLIEKKFKSGCPELWGHSDKKYAVHADYIDDKIYVFFRNNGRVEAETEDFRPFLLADYELFKFCADSEEYQAVRLEGDSCFNCAVYAENASALQALSKKIAEECGSARSSKSGQMYINDMVNLFLLKSGITMYGSMSFEDVQKAFITVCTSGGNIENLRFYQDEAPEFICMRMSSGQQKIFCFKDFKSEKEMLNAFMGQIAEADPDIIFGHGLYDDILPYLKNRCKISKAKFNLGRSFGNIKIKEPSGRRTYMQIAGKRYDYANWEIPGRDAADTLMLARLRDVTSRELEIFDIRETADSLNVSVSAEELASCLPEEASERLQETVRLGILTQKAADILFYPFFLQAQFFPYSVQNTILRGNATRINSLFLRSYLHRGVSVPEKPEGNQYAGALVGSEVTGIVENVLHCDVQSLYPSIMLAYKLGPEKDTLNIFLGMLSKLREFRLLAKDMRRQELKSQSCDIVKANFYDILQNTFKILINSFYGYLGFNQGNFADFERAAQVTLKGREILDILVGGLRNEGCSIVEYDTDGVYFTRDEELIRSPEKRRELIDAVNALLPEGIDVDLDGIYKSMYCHSAKNYALADFDGKVSFSGATFRSRTREMYLRSILQQITALVLNGEQDKAESLILKLKADLADHKADISQLVKTEVLNDSVENYQKKTAASGRNRAAAYEVALRQGNMLKAGQIVRYYITGTKKTVRAFECAKDASEYNPSEPDENSAYYIGKLDALLEQFPLLVPEHLLKKKKR